jgi:hypothetical protein
MATSDPIDLSQQINSNNSAQNSIPPPNASPNTLPSHTKPSSQANANSNSTTLTNNTNVLNENNANKNKTTQPLKPANIAASPSRPNADKVPIQKIVSYSIKTL